MTHQHENPHKNNQEIRAMKKEARYQMSIEKGLGFYKPKFITKWIKEYLPGRVSEFRLRARLNKSLLY